MGITRSQLRRQLWAMAGIFLPPMAGVESIERRLGRISILRPINRLQRAGEGFAVLPGGEIHRMADQMDDARLNDRLRKDGVDRLRKALQSVDDCDQNVIDAAVLQLVHHPQPEFGAFGIFDPKAQDILRPIRLNAERNVHRLVPDKPFVSDFDPQGVEKNERIARLQRPILPFADRLQNRVRHSRNQVGETSSP